MVSVVMACLEMVFMAYVSGNLRKGRKGSRLLDWARYWAINGYVLVFSLRLGRFVMKFR